MKQRRTPIKVMERLLELCDYFNSIESGICRDSDRDFLLRFGYANRKALQRDLKQFGIP